MTKFSTNSYQILNKGGGYMEHEEMTRDEMLKYEID